MRERIIPMQRQFWEKGGELVMEPQKFVIPPSGRLTSRQMEVLELRSQGLSNRLIAPQLHLSLKTVYVHINRISKALGVSAPNIVEKAVEVGIVTNTASSSSECPNNSQKTLQHKFKIIHGDLVPDPDIQDSIDGLHNNGVTESELRILRLMGQGMTIGQQSEGIKRSVKTIQAERSGLYKKLGLKKELQALVDGIKRGLIEPRSLLPKDFDQRKLNKLTPREKQIIELLIEGALGNEDLVNTSIFLMRKLQITQKTVDVHFTHILDKLDVHRRVDAVAIYLACTNGSSIPVSSK